MKRYTFRLEDTHTGSGDIVESVDGELVYWDTLAELFAVVEAAKEMRACYQIGDYSAHQMVNGHMTKETMVQFDRALAALEAKETK